MFAIRRFKPRVVEDWKIQEAAKQLAAGVPQAQICRDLGVGEGTLNRIANGTASLAGRPGAYERCGGCGGKQLASEPCRVCRHRKEKQCA